MPMSTKYANEQFNMVYAGTQTQPRPCSMVYAGKSMVGAACITHAPRAAGLQQYPKLKQRD
jgi:hypothetical protein